MEVIILTNDQAISIIYRTRENTTELKKLRKAIEENSLLLKECLNFKNQNNNV